MQRQLHNITNQTMNLNLKLSSGYTVKCQWREVGQDNVSFNPNHLQSVVIKQLVLLVTHGLS